MKPRRTRAVPRLSLLGEQGADVSRELTCNVLCVQNCLDNFDRLFALMITPGFYLHHVEVVDQDIASGSQ